MSVPHMVGRRHEIPTVNIIEELAAELRRDLVSKVELSVKGEVRLPPAEATHHVAAQEPLGLALALLRSLVPRRSGRRSPRCGKRLREEAPDSQGQEHPCSPRHCAKLVDENSVTVLTSVLRRRRLSFGWYSAPGYSHILYAGEN
jgi:hypothetical protein